MNIQRPIVIHSGRGVVLTFARERARGAASINAPQPAINMINNRKPALHSRVCVAAELHAARASDNSVNTASLVNRGQTVPSASDVALSTGVARDQLRELAKVAALHGQVLDLL